MTEKKPQEQAAADRQVELLSNAFDRAAENQGIWLNKEGKKAPAFYQKEVTISPFNAIILGLHSDQREYKTNQFTLFSDAKKRGESVQTKEKGVPFLWYNWNEYANKNNPEEKISRSDYQALSKEEQTNYKGIRTREIRTLFNIEQTTLPFTDKPAFEKILKESGRLSERESIEQTSKALRSELGSMIGKVNDNMVEVRTDTTGIAHYNQKEDKVYLPNQEQYEDFNDYARAAIEQIVIATGNRQRLAREGMTTKNGRPVSEDAIKQERLVVEMATAVRLQELGIPARLSKESLSLTDYWKRELKENPCLIDTLERDVNNAIDMIRKAERGEKIVPRMSQDSQRTSVKTIIPKHYYVADEIKTLPNKDTKEMVIVRDPSTKMADVIIPMGASLAVENEIPGMNKNRIEHALNKEGYDTVTFYNPDGSLGYRPDDSFFDGKEVSVARLYKWDLEDITKLDVTDAVKRSGAVDFDKILMLKDNDGKWALFIKPENENSFSVYPDKSDVNRFFVALKQGNDVLAEQTRQDLGTKYYVMANDKPELKVDIFKSQATPEELAKIERVNIFKTKETAEKPSRILCMPTISGDKQQPREISPQQWQHLWLAENMKEYKQHLAATIFADVIREEKKDTVHEEYHEEKDKHQQREEQAHSDYHEEEDKKNAAKEEQKPEPVSKMLKQFLDLKAKHPDALLLFRTGDFYETYKEDAEKASNILGITLTRSSKTKDEQGKPLTIAGFPYHALDTYLPRLIRAGQRVAICDQIEDIDQKKDNTAQVKGNNNPKENEGKSLHR